MKEGQTIGQWLNWDFETNGFLEIRKKFSKAKKGKTPDEKTKIRQIEVIKGSKWWNDGNGNTKMSKECPGEGWILGRGKIKV